MTKGNAMLGERYIVKPGDNLWNISKFHLGAGAQWRRVWRYNNRTAVVQITGRGIPNPDLIYPGQVLLLPILPGSARQGTTSAQTQAATPPARQPAVVVAPSSPPPGQSGQPLRAPQPAVPGPRSDNQPAESLSRELPQIESPISIKYRLDDLLFPPIVQPGAIMEMHMTGDVLLMTKSVYPAVYVTQRREIEMQVVQQANHAFGAWSMTRG
jgi:nucleoid-associated protein YgaU